MVKGKRCDVTLIVIVIAEDHGSQALGATAAGGTYGLELLTKESAGQLARNAAEEGVRLLNRRAIPQKRLPIVFANRYSMSVWVIHLKRGTAKEYSRTKKGCNSLLFRLR